MLQEFLERMEAARDHIVRALGHIGPERRLTFIRELRLWMVEFDRQIKAVEEMN